MKRFSMKSIVKSAAAVTAFAFVFPVMETQIASSLNVDAVSGVAVAQDKKKQPRKLPGISESFFKQMGKVQPLLTPDTEKDPNAQPDFRAAITELQKMERRCKEKCNPYELSQIYRFYGFAYYSLEDIDNAIKYYDLVVKQTPNIPLGVEKQTLYTLAQLEYSEEDYDSALSYLDKWFKLADDVSADVHFLVATINYQKNDKPAALKSISTAISMVEGEGKVAKEQWYNLKRALFLEDERYKESLPVLEKLVRNYPKHSYWVQLGGIYGILGRDKDQLHAFEAAYTMDGLVKEQEFLNLAYLYLGEAVPFKAATVIEAGMKKGTVKRSTKNLETLAQAYGQAQEPKKALSVLQEAVEKSKTEPLKDPKKDKRKTGDLLALMVGYYLDIDDNKGAIRAGKQALQAGNIKEPGFVHSNMGIAYVDQKQYSNAISSFEKAVEFPKQKRFAQNWLKHARSELNREQALAAAQ